MKKRKFVGVTIIGGIICFICFIFGKNKGFRKGYKEADRTGMNEGSQSV